MAEEILTGLDIGSSSIRVVVGQIVPGEEGKNALHIIGAQAVPAIGIHRGSISSIEDAVSSISKALERSERMTGVAINSAWVSIAGQNILVQESRGVIGVNRQESEIGEADVERVIEAARTVATPSNYEILHVIPKSFTVDGQKGIKDPVGMNGIRLEVDAVIVQTLSSQIKNITKSVYRTGLDIDDLVFTPLATAEAVLSQNQKELGVCVVDVGATSTSMVIYEEGDMLHTAVLPIGGDHITHDVAIGLKTSLEVAERIKHTIGSATPKSIDKKEEYSLKDFGGMEDEVVNRQFIAKIIEARTEEIFEAVDDELRKVDRSGMLPVGAVLTGASIKLDGIHEVAKNTLRLPVHYGESSGFSSVIDEVRDPGYTTAIGLALWGFAVRSSKGSKFSFSLGSLKGAVDGITKWIKSLSS